VAYKYADPAEDTRWIADPGEAREIIAEDPSLIVWAILDPPLTDLDPHALKIADPLHAQYFRKIA
jgi:hypothetical protein